MKLNNGRKTRLNGSMLLNMLKRMDGSFIFLQKKTLKQESEVNTDDERIDDYFTEDVGSGC